MRSRGSRAGRSRGSDTPAGPSRVRRLFGSVRSFTHEGHSRGLPPVTPRRVLAKVVERPPFGWTAAMGPVGTHRLLLEALDVLAAPDDDPLRLRLRVLRQTKGENATLEIRGEALLVDGVGKLEAPAE